MGADNQAEKVILNIDCRTEIARIAGVLDTVRCRFMCSSPVVGIYWMPKGCVCYADPVQALCAQHAVKAEPIGAMTLIAGPGLP